MKKVLVAMSGGVDSSVAAFLLKERGFYVEGVTAIFFNETKGLPEYLKKAQTVCEKIGIKHNVLNFEEEFKRVVVDYFVKSYQEGKTPNPCILCNKFFKFGKILKFAENLGFDFLATGHYAKIFYDEKRERYVLQKSQNEKKDQSYFLYFLKQEQLKKIIFPLEDLEKETIKKIAQEQGFFSKEEIKESQDICFIKGEKYSSFVVRNIKNENCSGEFVDTSGKVLGKHSGIFKYTIGQRKGIGLSFAKPMFVKEIDCERNRVVLAHEEELFQKDVLVGRINLILSDEIKEPICCRARVRYRQKEEEAVVCQIGEDILKVSFKRPQRAVAKGQALVMYLEDLVFGGGEIF